MAETLKKWFCLNGGRQNFKPNVRSDSNVIFCHDDKINKQVHSSIERSFATGEPVKMMLYGDWGVGKTHTVHHISWWLGEQAPDFNAVTVFVEVGDVSKKSKFDVLLRPFLDAIGLNKVVELVGRYNAATGKHVSAGLGDAGVGSNVINAFSKLLLISPGDTAIPQVEQSFEHLKGGLVREAPSIGLSQQLTQSQEFYDVLLSLGELYQAVEGAQIIFIADEAAKLEDVEADDATRAHWIATNRLIFDDNNTSFGFIYTLSAQQQSHIPEVLTHEQILNRLGNNLIQLDNLSGPEVSDFLARLRESFIDMNEVKKLDADGHMGAEFDENTYPFTPAGSAYFIDYWDRNQPAAKPRDICDKMNDVAFNALKDGKRLIDPIHMQAEDM